METIASQVYKPADFSAGQVHEMLVTLGKRGFSPQMAAEVANARSGKAQEIVGLFRSVLDLDPIAFWQKFYQDFCDLETDFSQAGVPDPVGDFTLVLGIPEGLTPNRIYEPCARHFKCWRYADDLDAIITHNDREPTKSYFIKVRDRQEADEELKNLSANDIKTRCLTTETLTERLVHEAVYYYRTGEHLDVSNITLCSGSRNQDGSVPDVDWRRLFGRVHVSCYFSGGSSGILRSRQVVS